MTLFEKLFISAKGKVEWLEGQNDLIIETT
jgi:hypothetical protein